MLIRMAPARNLLVAELLFCVAAYLLKRWCAGKCGRASLFFWVSQVAWRRMRYGFGSAAVGVLKLWGYSAVVRPIRDDAPRMRMKSSAVMVSVYCVWPSFFLDWISLCRHSDGAEGVSLAGFLAHDTLGGFLRSGIYLGLGYLFRRAQQRRWT